MSDLSDKNVLILGLGASGLAMARWCAGQGARVRVWDSRANPPQAAALAAEIADSTFFSGELTAETLAGVARVLERAFSLRRRARISVLPWTAEGLAAALEGASTLISAVPAIAWQGKEARAGLRALERSAAVLEMAYGPPTPLAAVARQQVARYQDGIPMLVHQAARAVALALGSLPPAEPLLKAARA